MSKNGLFKVLEMVVTPVTINSVQENNISFFYLFAVFEILLFVGPSEMTLCVTNGWEFTLRYIITYVIWANQKSK